MTALPDWDIVSDGDLARAAAAGERVAFGRIYDRYADRLHDFCIGMVREREAAADCVQEVFCTAAVQLTKLRDPDKLRPWLYAIARNEALRFIRQRRRESASDDLPEVQSWEAGPDTLAARTELADLIAAAAGGLSERDRAVLELSYRCGLDGPELAEALGVSVGNATKLASRLRETVERSLGALLVARRAQRNPQECSELSAILANWDGRFSVLMRKRIARHIDSCGTCERNRRDLVTPKALLGVVPILVAAPWWLRGQTLHRVQLTSADFAMAPGTDANSAQTAGHGGYQHGGAAAHPGSGSQFEAAHAQGRRFGGIKAVCVLATILILALGLTFVWLHHRTTSVNPSDVTVTTPARTETGTRAPAPTQPGSQRPASSAPTSNPLPRSTAPSGHAPTPVSQPPPGGPTPRPTVAPPAQPNPPSVPSTVPTRSPVTTTHTTVATRPPVTTTHPTVPTRPPVTITHPTTPKPPKSPPGGPSPGIPLE
jgi:RNA polymerase sigma factor (sigma-70 family)